MNAAWLSSPVVLTGMRMPSCAKKIPAECAYYKQRWHFWYEADHVFAIPTVLFFICAIGLFILSHIVSILFLRKRKIGPRSIWQRGLTGLRTLGYEFFKATHIFAVVVFMVTFFWHCDHTLTSWHYFVATAAVYIPCFVYPWLRSVFEYKWTQKAHIAVEDNGFTRINIPANFHWTQGQHCFLRFTSFGILPADEASELVFYICHQGGFTAKLYQHALLKSDVPISVVVDGPYGGVNPSRLWDADRLFVIAGGSGAGWCLPLIEHFARSASTSSDEEQGKGELVEKPAPRSYRSKHISLRVVLATRDTRSRLWFERTVAELLAKFPTPGLSSSVRVQIYLTGEAAQVADLSTKAANPAHSTASTSSNEIIVETGKGVEPAAAVVPGIEFQGRPQLPQIVQEEATRAADAGESLSVYVCGPETMQNDVRNAVAAENLKIFGGSLSGGVYLHSEHFSWA
ncbi:ferric reductase [Pyrenophora tritici-repentis]|nr:ferric reductase [Pyrenophora tritici-repentis]